MIRKWTSILCIVVAMGILVAPAFGQAPVQPPGQAQPNPGGKPAGGAGQPQAGQAKKNEPVEHGPPAAQYTVALAATLGILVIVCMPSRKR